MSLASTDSHLTRSAASLALSEARRHVKNLSIYNQTCKQFADLKKRFAFRRVRHANDYEPAHMGRTGSPFRSLRTKLGHNLRRGSRTHPPSLPSEASAPSSAFSHNTPHAHNDSASQSCAPPQKRRIDWDAEERSAGPSTAYNGRSKKSRLATGGSCADIDEHMPLDSSPSVTNTTYQFGFAGGIIPKAFAKFYHPRTSPLGPQTSVYQRRSRISPQPSKRPGKSNLNLSIRCTLQAFEIDIITRDPYSQNAQWCEDLLVTNLKDVFHPNYTCPHLYHPSDPEYDEEWSGETWSDEEWSDSEGDDEVTTLSDGNDEQGVKILAPEEDDQTDMVLDTTPSQWNPAPQQFLSMSSAWRHNPVEDIEMSKSVV